MSLSYVSYCLFLDFAGFLVFFRLGRKKKLLLKVIATVLFKKRSRKWVCVHNGQQYL